MKSLHTQYNAGSRAPDAVQAYRDYHRADMRTRRRYQSSITMAHRIAALEQMIGQGLKSQIAETRQQIVAELVAERKGNNADPRRSAWG